ncbi:MAG: hypothetical protein WC307_01535 [Candidatus Nanoarchaeia archaeon]|jgi:hypothetical protein
MAEKMRQKKTIAVKPVEVPTYVQPVDGSKLIGQNEIKSVESFIKDLDDQFKSWEYNKKVDDKDGPVIAEPIKNIAEPVKSIAEPVIVERPAILNEINGLLDDVLDGKPSFRPLYKIDSQELETKLMDSTLYKAVLGLGSIFAGLSTFSGVSNSLGDYLLNSLDESSAIPITAITSLLACTGAGLGTFIAGSLATPIIAKGLSGIANVPAYIGGALKYAGQKLKYAYQKH